MNIDLDAIQARADAATEGPWKVRECSPCTERGRLEVNIWDGAGNFMITNWCDDDEFHRPDAEFIAAARTDVPALLALVRSQQVRLDEFEAKYGEHTTENQGRGCPACTAAIRVKDRERAALAATEGQS